MELTVNGKKLDRKPMPRNGHLSWKAVFQPGAVKAVGYKNGKNIGPYCETPVLLPVSPLTADRPVIQADNRVTGCDVTLSCRTRRNVCPHCCNDLTITVSVRYASLGWGMETPLIRLRTSADADARTYQVKAFNGLAGSAVAKYRRSRKPRDGRF